jgi:hypothetical protein
MAIQLEVPGSTSLYNDRKGIKVTVSFQPLLPPLKLGEKRHKNAKPKAINHITYIHEEQGLSEFLDTVIDDINEASNLAFSIANRSGLLDTDSFTLEYTINHSDSKDILIQNIADYKALIDEITTLNCAAASFKLLITEQNVSFEGCTCRLTKHIWLMMRCPKMTMEELPPKRRCVYWVDILPHY